MSPHVEQELVITALEQLKKDNFPIYIVDASVYVSGGYYDTKTAKCSLELSNGAKVYFDFVIMGKNRTLYNAWFQYLTTYNQTYKEIYSSTYDDIKDIIAVL